MNFPFYIAKRYLLSRKKQNIINIISGIAVAGVMVGTTALIVVLSVYNGFDTLVKSMFSAFDPGLKITSAEKKTFSPDEIDYNALSKIEGVAYWADVLEENALLKYGDREGIATIKGVSSNYQNLTGLDSLIVGGSFTLENEGYQFAVFGYGVAQNLGLGIRFTDPVQVYSAKKGKTVSANMQASLNYDFIYPSGIFSVQEQIDSKYVIAPLNFARTLFDIPANISAIEIKLKQGADTRKTQKEIQSLIGKSFHVKNKYQQHELVYKVMKSEKWAIFLILSFILLVASFNILGSLSMLILDKKNDISVLRSMGAGQKQIRQIFLLEGWLISFIGSISGLISGVLLCYIQIHFHLITFPGNGTFAVSAYPVEIQFPDILLTFLIVSFIGFILSWYPARYISEKYMPLTVQVKS